jgi:hypothetical protein
MRGLSVKSFYVTLFVLLLIADSFAQKESYIPLNIKPAYEKGTRSLDGNPGPNYWQNSAKYNIKVNLDPRLKILFGSEEIIYNNNSPDSLSQIVVRLYQNISKATALRDFYLNEKALTDGMKIVKIKIFENDVDVNNNKIINVIGTNMIINLIDKLAPKKSIKLSFDWEFKIPEVQTIRFGSYDSTSMFVAYWYPQIAVYDDVDGWDRKDYAGTLEMYNDYNDYNVEFSIPAGFQVWATGVWQNANEILNQKYLDRYNLAWKSDEVIKIFEKVDLGLKDIYKTKNDFHTLKFKADHVPDFAFGISDHYLWDAVSCEVENTSGRRVYCASAYRQTSPDFVDVAYYAKESLKYFSFEIPGVPYPYPCATIFNGAGGMEFPMIVNNGREDNKAGTVHLTSHELSHQYFPFYVGTNERKYPFMDEGFAVMLPFDFQERTAEGYRPRERYVQAYEDFAGNEYDLPLMIPSPTISYRSYRTSGYNKPAIAYDILRKTLGDELFLKALHTYMDRWNGKHPIPTDFFFTFNEVVGKDLGWYWNPWFYDFSYPNLSISNVKSKKNSIVVEVKNIGSLPLPIKLQVMYNDSVVKEVYNKADVWQSGKNKIEIKIDGIKNYDAIILGCELVPDINSVNNVYIK